VAIVALLGAQVVAMAGIDTPWIAFEPGSATSTDGLLAVDGAQTFDDAGQIMYLTVRQNRLSMLEWVVKARDPYIAIERESDLYPDVDREEVRQQNLDLMVRSKSDAELVALQHLGYDVFDTVGAQVTAVEPGSAADGTLSPNQVITAVDGAPVRNADELIAALRGLDPGTTVTLSLQTTDGTDAGTAPVTLGARPDGTPGGFLGITTATWFVESPDIPVTIEIESGEVGGNSAGLAFTLSIIDQLTPGDLVGGMKVAVTGTMQLNGTVGDVGGVSQKAVAARRSGADVMLVPRNLEAEAKKTAGDMQVIPVSTLDEALDALANLGGNANELALPGTTAPPN
jgi:Lon-like protease